MLENIDTPTVNSGGSQGNMVEPVQLDGNVSPHENHEDHDQHISQGESFKYGQSHGGRSSELAVKVPMMTSLHRVGRTVNVIIHVWGINHENRQQVNTIMKRKRENQCME